MIYQRNSNQETRKCAVPQCLSLVQIFWIVVCLQGFLLLRLIILHYFMAVVWVSDSEYHFSHKGQAAFDFMQLKQRHKSNPALNAPLMEIYGKILQHQSTLMLSRMFTCLWKTFNRNNYTKNWGLLKCKIFIWKRIHWWRGWC